MAHVREITTRIPQPVRFGLRRVAFLGSNRTCELCGSSVRGFRDHGPGFEVLDRRRVVGGMKREDDRCPVCHACDRTRLMKLYLERHAGVGSRPVSLLHVAPDLGLYRWLSSQPLLTYVGSDIDAERYRHIEFMKSADLTDLPFASATFDIVVCSHVLEHVPDDAAAMAEIRRVLVPGGRAMLLVPLATDGEGTDEDPEIEDPAERERHFGQWDHVRLYGKQDFVDRLHAQGFDVALYDAFEQDPNEAQRLALNPLEQLPIATRPDSD